jgi:large subunit ribosomal protein L16
MLEPKRRKFRKDFRGKMRGKSTRGASLAFGEFGIKSLGRGWLTARQIEAARRTLTHTMKRGGRVWIRVFPDKPVTGRPAGQRMGSGKGDIQKYVSVITPGRIIFEVGGASDELMIKALKLATDKLPFKTKTVSREE